MCLFVRREKSPVHQSSMLMVIAIAVTLMLLSGISVRAGRRWVFFSPVMLLPVPLESQEELGSVCFLLSALSFLAPWGCASLQPGQKPALRG